MVDWRAAVKDPRAILLLEKLVSGELQELKPAPDPKRGVHYPEVDALVGEEESTLIQTLEGQGVLERREVEKVVSCPLHENASDIRIRLKCPSCQSLMIDKGNLVQHTVCGFSGSFEQFKAGEALTCPGCKRQPAPTDLKNIGSWYECQDCKGRFGHPAIYLYCGTYGHDFKFEEARVIGVPSYRLAPAVSTELKGKFGPLVSLSRMVEPLGFKAEIFGQIKGSSGFAHPFDLVLSNGFQYIPVEIKTSESAVDEASVMSTFLKIFDIQASKAFIIAIPTASEGAKKLAKSYRVTVCEGKDANEVFETLKADLLASQETSSQETVIQ